MRSIPLRTKRSYSVALIAIFAALAVILSYVENIVSFGFVFPGFKIGLSNVTVLAVLYIFGSGTAVVFGLCKSFFSLLLFGRLSSLLFSVGGMALSLIIMIILKKTGRFSLFAVSACGSVFHVWGQVFAAALCFSTLSVFGFIPYLSLLAVGSGITVAAVARPVVERANSVLTKRT